MVTYFIFFDIISEPNRSTYADTNTGIKYNIVRIRGYNKSKKKTRIRYKKLIYNILIYKIKVSNLHYL